jgi:hypothetical protein
MLLKRLVPIIICTLPWATLQNVAHAETSTIDPSALMQQAIHVLNASESFNFTTDIGYQVTQENGQNLEFGSHREISVQRPDKMHIQFQRRKGESGDIYLDGQHITLISNIHQVYAQTQQLGEIDESIDYMAQILEIPIPLSDFFMPDPEENVLDDLTNSDYIGTAIINGTLTHNLAFRNDNIDFQAWLTAEKVPKLKRIVIIYKKLPGQPQFWAQISSWNLTPTPDQQNMSPTIPKDYERVPMLISKTLEQTTPVQESQEESAP